MSEPVKLSKEERKAKREAEKNRPKRRYIKKSEQLKGIKISNEAVIIRFD